LQSGDTCIEVAATANALYLRSFEDLVSASIRCEEKGLTENDRIANIRVSYKRCIGSNIEYHELMANTENELGNKDSAALHAAMAKAYSAFILE
jgi:hypothetical protein